MFLGVRRTCTISLNYCKTETKHTNRETINKHKKKKPHKKKQPKKNPPCIPFINLIVLFRNSQQKVKFDNVVFVLLGTSPIKYGL